MEIEVVTRSKSRKEFLIAVANLYAKELGLSRSKTNVRIETVTGLLKSTGYRGGCIKIADGFIAISLDSRLNTETVCTVLAHEMVHAKQYAFGQLKLDDVGYRWLGKRWHDTQYYDYPWEIEAFSRERLLANKIAKLLAAEQ